MPVSFVDSGGIQDWSFDMQLEGYEEPPAQEPLTPEQEPVPAEQQ